METITSAGTDRQTGPYDISALVLRVMLGAIFVAHGGQKLFGMFGGDLDGVAAGMASSGLRPGMFFAVLAGVLELAAGLLLLIGLLTPLAGLIITGVMIVAIARVTGQGGFVMARGVGYEYNLILIAAAVALAISGPGRLSLDHKLGLDRRFSLDRSSGKRVREPRQVAGHSR